MMLRGFIVGVFMFQWIFSMAQWTISDITLENNKHTKDFIILRNLNFAVGDTVSLHNLDALIVQNTNNLENTALFNVVKITYQTDSITHRIQFTVYVEERWYLWPYPILEHADRNFSSFVHYQHWDKINYGFFLVKYNFRGRQEVLKAKIRKGYHEQYGFFYDKPFFHRHKDKGIGLSMAYNRQQESIVAIQHNRPLYFRDSMPINHSFLTTFYGDHHWGLYKTLTLSLEYAHRQISTSLIQENPIFLGTPRTSLEYLSASASFVINKCNIHYYPLYGYRISMSANYLGNPSSRQISVASVQLTGARYWQRQRWSWAMFINGYLADNNTAFFLQQGMGYYGHYLRGFEYFVINGNAYFMNKYFLRYNILKRKDMHLTALPLPKFNKPHVAVYGNVFFENGYVNNNRFLPINDNTMQNAFLYSYGIGLDFVTYYDKVFRIDFSRNNFGYSGFYLHMSAPF